MPTLLAESYLHQLDAVVLPIWGDLKIRWYGLAYITGFLVAWGLLRWMGRTRRVALEPESSGDFMFAIILGVVLGGRLGHAIFYAHGAPFWTFTGSFPYWELLAINRGGMSAHGGILGVIVACTVYGLRRGLPPGHLLDAAALLCTPGLFLGRIANFVNGELWGRPLPGAWRDDPPGWSIKYPEEIAERWHVAAAYADEIDPTLVHRIALDLEVTAESTDALRDAVRVAAESRLDVAAARLVGSAPDLVPLVGGRPMLDVEATIATLRDATAPAHEAAVSAVQPLLTPYWPSQVFQAATDGPLLAAVLIIAWWRPRKPGVIGSLFLLAYGVMRIATEFFRQPDEGVSLLLGLSRGQVLSIAMVVGGAIALQWASRQPVPRLGGLGPGAAARGGATPAP